LKTLLQRYSEAVLDGFDLIIRQTDLLGKAGALLTEAKVNGGRFLLYDRGFDMSLDTWTRGSNPCDNHIYRYSRREFQDGDCLILGSYWADDPDDLTVAQELRAKNNTGLITISPHKKPPEQRTDKLLHETADVAIDNGTDNQAGAFTVEGIDGAILPYVRDINLTINQAIVAEYIQQMVEKGRPPTQFYMVHFPYFREIQDIMNERIKKYGY